MPQDFNVSADNQRIDQSRQDAIKAQAKERGEVYPFDTQKVYATKMLVDAASIHDIKEVGQEFEVHPSIAKKLIASGKASEKKPGKTEQTDDDAHKAKATAK